MKEKLEEIQATFYQYLLVILVVIWLIQISLKKRFRDILERRNHGKETRKKNMEEKFQ